MNEPRPFKRTPWTAFGPEAWPNAPEELSFSVLHEIEACPRRWALSAASYPTIWNDRGYPTRTNIKAASGSVVHTVLETVTKELVKAGCPSVMDASAVQVLQRLGGLSKILANAIDKWIAHNRTNPRLARLSDYFGQALRSQLPELRSRAQAMLARRDLSSKSNNSSDTVATHERRALRNGVYCELDLRVSQIGWKGRTDFLMLSPDSCEIIDFKTGEPSEDHASQLRVYATLWYRDAVLNPTARLATSLVLAYRGGDVAVPAPTPDELKAIEDDLIKRGESAHHAVSLRPPDAKPSEQVCRFCGVRQLCDTYWNPEVQKQFFGLDDPDSSPFIDVEVVVRAKHGPRSWDVFAGPDKNKGLLRTKGDFDFTPGQRLRILDILQAIDESEGGRIRCLTIGDLSEVYEVV